MSDDKATVTQAKLLLLGREKEIFSALRGGQLTHEERELHLEQLAEIRQRMRDLDRESMRLSAKGLAGDDGMATAVVLGVDNLSPGAAAAEAEAIRRNPHYWDPNKAIDGKKMSAQDHVNLVARHSALLGRAADGGQQ